MITPCLDSLWSRGKELLAVQYPIMCGAMTWVSEPNLVSAVCEAGAFASLACGNMPPEELRRQIAETRRRTSRPFAVNLITVAPNYLQHLEVVIEEKLPVIIFAGSVPRDVEIEKAKASGAKVLAFASTDALAKRMIRFGVDGLILEGSEAGGHIGPVAGPILWQQILFRFSDQVPIFIAGGVATGKMMAHLLLMGAAGVQLGTRFVMTDECVAHPNFKEEFRRAQARDAMASPQFDSRLPVIPVRALKNKGTVEFGKLQIELLKKLDAGEIDRETAQLEVERFWIGALRRAVIEGDVEYGSLMAGQTVGLADEIMPVRMVIQELVTDAERELQLIAARLQPFAS
ncbi:MAG: nitronate monooxygenase [bacterium]|nr:nitronate monooxygenase [bacterium]